MTRQQPISTAQTGKNASQDALNYTHEDLSARPKTPKRLVSTILMLGTSVLLLSLLFPPFYCFFFAPVALVPFCMCVLRRAMTKRYMGAYWAAGAVFFLLNLWWMAPVSTGGYIALSLFVGLYFVVFAVGIQRLIVQFRLPATIAVPVVWTAVEYVRANFVLGGFPWFLLGNSLTPLPLLIQGADVFGVWGVTFLIAMANGFFVDLLRLPLWHVDADKKTAPRFSPIIGRLIALNSVVIAAVVAYGIFRMGQNVTHAGPRVAVIQENIPQSIKDSPGTRDQVFIKHLDLSRQAALSNPKPDLVAWPETMVTAPINDDLIIARPDTFADSKELLPLLTAASSDVDEHGHAKDELTRGDDEYRRIADIYRSLEMLVTQTQVPVLVGYAAYTPERKPLSPIIQNRTLLLEAGGRAGMTRRAEYSKRHLVPFGEYMPFRDVPGLGRLMLMLSPVDEDYTNTPGREWTRFMLEARGAQSEAGVHPAGGMETYSFSTPICFEDAMPEPARMMTAPQEHGGRKADFLVNVSNDGWFHAVELDQHLQACQLRAVENRVSIARSVNTGNSGFIDSNGRIIKLVSDSNGRSIGVVGFESMVMPVDTRVTIYSRIGDLFPIVCGIVATLLTGWTFVRPRRAA
ncbi:MAG TPA: apolipoprotein N-acyltransferase [Phycisphaerae bacterium]